MKREEIRESLKCSVALVKEIRTKMREAHGEEKSDLRCEKNSERPFRRCLCLALAYLNGTPYAKAEASPDSGPYAARIAKILGIEEKLVKDWIGGEQPKREPPLMKLYVITRSDLPPGARAVQAAHAMREFAAEFPVIEKEWHEKSNTLVMLEAPDEKALYQIHLEAGLAKIPATFFREPDLGHSVTALALGPSARKLACVRNLPLALSKEEAA